VEAAAEAVGYMALHQASALFLNTKDRIARAGTRPRQQC
jgi:hypothetical protein